MLRLLRRYLFKKIKVMSNNSSKQPIVVILGATGTGKSKLALEVSLKFNGEIISADSMQIYKSLEIATNKVTSTERTLVPHHMLDFLDPFHTYTVVDFRNAALPIISGLHEEGKLPIIVGGTHYYVESLLWNVLIQSESAISKSNIKEESDISKKLSVHESNSECNEISVNVKLNRPIFVSDIDKDKVISSDYNSGCNKNHSSESCESSQNWINTNASNEELLKKLEEIDPEIALTYHPNNRRKILRSLEVWQQTGVRHSEHLRRQSEEVGGADLGGSARFENAAILWVTCKQEILDERLDARVEEMIDKGLMEELSEFHATYCAPLFQKLEKVDDPEDAKKILHDYYSKGIFQNIGLKEFHEYLSLNEDERKSLAGQKLFEKGKEEMKLRTRQYSRRQIKWVKNRFLLRNRKKYPVYAVDGTDLTLWNDKVRTPAEEVIASILKGEVPTTIPCKTDMKNSEDKRGDKSRHVCEICNRLFIGEIQWNEHQRSGKHRKMLKRKAEENNKLLPETFSNKCLKS